jgi:hypothetical protein
MLSKKKADISFSLTLDFRQSLGVHIRYYAPAGVRRRRRPRKGEGPAC